jgi:aldehyde dehydrogenase (NAD+)
VHADVYDEVVEQVVSSLAAVRTGDPLDEETEMGPVVSEDACNRITGIIERAQATGAGKLLLAAPPGRRALRWVLFRAHRIR